MKTRSLFLLLAIVMLAALPACGRPSAPDGPAGETQNAGGVPQSGPPADPQERPDEALGLFRADATLAETVLVDEGGVKITATGLTYTGYSADLELTIENNSGKNLSFVSGSLGYSCNSVNGYMVNDGYLNCDVADGKKANDSISFNCDALMLYGIDEIADMEIGFSMTDEEYNTTYSGPRQLKTSAFDTHDYGADHYQASITSQASMSAYGYEMLHFARDALYEQNGVKLRSSGVITNRDGGTALLLELENTTDSTVYVSTSDIAINGLVVNSSAWSSDAVNPGKRAVVTLELSSVLDPAYWSAYGITDVGSVSLSLGQRDEKGLEIAAEVPVEIVIPGMSASFDASGTEVYHDNGLRIVSKALAEDPSGHSADLYALLLAENSSGRTLTVDDVYDSLSVNGFMTDYSFSSRELRDGESGTLVIKLWESSLEENQIGTSADVQEIEIGLEISEGHTVMDGPIVTLSFVGQDRDADRS